MIVFHQDSKAIVGNSLFFKTEMHLFESLPAYPSLTRYILFDFKIGCFIKKTVVNPIAVPFPQSRGNFINPGIAGSSSTDFYLRVHAVVRCLAACLPSHVNVGALGSAGQWDGDPHPEVRRVPAGCGCKSMVLRRDGSGRMTQCSARVRSFLEDRAALLGQRKVKILKAFKLFLFYLGSFFLLWSSAKHQTSP